MLQDRKNLAIESFISSVDLNKSIMALGYFLIKIEGISYGIKKDDATALASLYDGVIRRIEMQGKHKAPYDLVILSSLELAQIVFDSTYGDISDEQFFLKYNISCDKLTEIIYKNNLIWAPDGNEAFDDGSKVFQFDIDDETVRLIGFNTTDDYKVDVSTLTDITINSNDFYSILKEWTKSFNEEWQRLVTMKR